MTDDADIEAFAAAGVDRLIVSPWARTREVPEGLVTFRPTLHRLNRRETPLDV